MTILEAIKEICNTAVPTWKLYFDDRQLMNVKADSSPFPLIFFEEYRQGNYRIKYFIEKTTLVELYFCKLCPMHNNGTEREHLRVQIEAEAIMPFIREFKRRSDLFEDISEFKFFTPPPRFDANEASIMLQFNAKLVQCI
ncbi:MAG: hypothetical protein LBP85_10450 [Prevotellaceae bacterium]|jgi:hypothetical protein|nr:hypothetical protein [Prevotellaceae bacterium]